MEVIFSITRIFIGFCQLQLGAKNLDLLILLIKNWHDALIVGIEDKRGLKYVDGFGEAKEDINRCNGCQVS
jgi:hypothetical protein